LILLIMLIDLPLVDHVDDCCDRSCWWLLWSLIMLMIVDQWLLIILMMSLWSLIMLILLIILMNVDHVIEHVDSLLQSLIILIVIVGMLMIVDQWLLIILMMSLWSLIMLILLIILMMMIHSCNPSGGMWLLFHSCNPSGGMWFLLLIIADLGDAMIVDLVNALLLVEWLSFWCYLSRISSFFLELLHVEWLSSWCYLSRISSFSLLFSSLYFHTVHFLHPDITCQWYGVSSCYAVRDFILIFCQGLSSWYYLLGIFKFGELNYHHHWWLHPDLLCQGFSNSVNWIIIIIDGFIILCY